MCAEMLDKGYEPGNVEKKWYAFWEKEQLFAAAESSSKPGYSIVIPPPNVTGVLHMGHALNITMQDVLCRYRRLRGDNVLWMPGTDHAGIATQNVVERQLAEEGLTRHAVGREKFIEKVWKWKKKSGSAIINQLKSLGASCDWNRERFTMDAGLSTAVKKVFVQLYREGLIYQGDYIINWCHRCHTALADLEVEHKELDGNLYHIRYPYADGNGSIVVATTRPETLLGDTAVAVNPEDERYADIPSTHVILPLQDKKIPIIRDSYVDMSFGTGGLKITPAHDPNDFELGRKHGLPAVKVINDEGFMTAEAGRFEGLDRIVCRDAVVKALEAEGFLKKIEPYRHSVGHCYRCKEIVEPNLSRQWFVKAKPLAAKAIEAVKTGRTRIIPKTWEKTYYDWLENIRDWCISRQIWWGHQIPAWTCSECGEMVVDLEAPEKCPGCQGTDLVQATDVLDTWFSSALWPFSTMGWPEETDLLKTFYPTSVLVTGFDILFFWVARMMMMGIHFMGEVPFQDVYVHALVRDENGKKMSKSKGNVIDPLTVIESHGTDAFRFTLAAFAVQGRDVKMSEKRVAGYRHFVNKLWNAARFSLMHIKSAGSNISRNELSLADRWILSRLSHSTETVAKALDDYKFNEAAATLYNFIWHEFCDWYLEASKPALYGEDARKKQVTIDVLYRVLKDTLVILHPLMPFVTEEIWHKLPGTDGSIMQASYPDSNDDAVYRDDRAETEMKLISGIITGIRNIRGEMNIAPSLELEVQIQSPDSDQREIMSTYMEMTCSLARAGSLSVSEPAEKPKTSAAVIVEGATVLVNLEGIIDFAMETARLNKEIAKITKELESVSRKLSNDGFLSKAPENIIEKVKEKHRVLSEKQEKLQAGKDRIQNMSN
jgi:valyl-tRNA synthetase